VELAVVVQVVVEVEVVGGVGGGTGHETMLTDNKINIVHNYILYVYSIIHINYR